MKKKEIIQNKNSIIEGTPTREERIKSLLSGKIIKIETNHTNYYKLDKYQRLCFSNTGHESSYHPYVNGYDYTKVLDDYDKSSGSKKIICIL